MLKSAPLRRRLLSLSVLTLCSTASAEPAAFYEFTQPAYIQSTPSRDGIGKRYMGREIAQVMGHQGAGWLDRHSRERDERTDRLVAALDLNPTDIVADIGAGTGYFVFRMAPLLPQGKVLAVDIQQEMLDIIAGRDAAAGNVEPVLGSITNINVPADSVDLILLVDAYHEFSHPREMVHSMVAALKPDGRVALVEYRAEDPAVAIKPLHKMSEAQAKREMEASGLQWIRTDASLPQQHLMFFAKSSPTP